MCELWVVKFRGQAQMREVRNRGASYPGRMGEWTREDVDCGVESGGSEVRQGLEEEKGPGQPMQYV